ncbi:NfeD family protein [Rodentibacter caecimuris]|uniref:NfeD family protein n=1 Tax=Rodentibacter caecimuris TaxID=1796644 RepID=UPI00109417A1|nr:NfeD family protein [Pasteurella caecimuris]MCR1836356.1 NfeD family protein [Pasteurella caecimuris]MCU0105893.1 NfeD family protein [Pasteurella caecimuris]TGY50385.1 NfeD family protein [Pasteurella caecimuris]
MTEWLTSWSLWHWLVLGFVLLIAEVIIPGVFLLWWGLAALVTALVQFIFPNFALTGLAIFYAVLACILSVIWWRYQYNKDNRDQAQSTLNQRDHAMLGKQGTVREIAANGIGRGAFDDTTWRIQGERLMVNELVKVVRVEGITLIVEKVITE